MTTCFDGVEFVREKVALHTYHAVQILIFSRMALRVPCSNHIRTRINWIEDYWCQHAVISLQDTIWRLVSTVLVDLHFFHDPCKGLPYVQNTLQRRHLLSRPSWPG